MKADAYAHKELRHPMKADAYAHKELRHPMKVKSRKVLHFKIGILVKSTINDGDYLIVPDSGDIEIAASFR